MKYIDADKLKDKVNELRQDWLGSSTGLEVAEEGAELGAAESILDSIDDLIDSLQQEQSDQIECVWIHKKYNREYRIVSDNAKLKDSDGKWIDCVIYAPLYENEFEMFAREKDSFYKEFEKK